MSSRVHTTQNMSGWDLRALQNRARELNGIIQAESLRRSAAQEELRQIDIHIRELDRVSKQTAKASMQEKVEKIKTIIKECQAIATEANIEFSLSDIGYMTEDEMLDNGWQSSSC